MIRNLSPWSINRIYTAWALLVLLIIGGCGSGSSGTGASQPPTVSVERDLNLSAAPHRFDIYRATNANKAIIILHGIGLTKLDAAYQFGVNLADPEAGGTDPYGTVNEEMLIDNRAMAVFPQGQAVPAAPLAFTWSNYVTDSGQDDMAFIRELTGYITARFGITRFYIVGHSTGGMLVNRIWCEQPELFDGYVSIAGPPSAHFLTQACSPAEIKPYFAVVRADDWVLGMPEDWDAEKWTVKRVLMQQQPIVYAPEAFMDPEVIGERAFLQSRVSLSCGEEVLPGDGSMLTEGPVSTWSFCGNSIRLVRVDSDMGLEPLQDAVWRFLSQP